MSAELSYVQLKAANEARVSEELRVEQRRKNLLVLTLHYLREEGFLDTAQTLIREAGPNITRYEVCDNIDLPTILQEYESYYNVKFRKNPKITKRTSTSAEELRAGHGHRSKVSSRSTKTSSTTLPPIPGTEVKGHNELGKKRPSSDGRRKDKRKTSQSHPVSTSDSSLSIHSPPSLPSISPPEELGLIGSSAIREGKKPKKGQVVNVKGMLQDAIRDASASINNPQDRLLKPIAGFAGYSGEMRELAAVISRDIYLHDPDVHWDDIVGLETAKRLVKEAVVYPIKYPQLFTGILSPWKGLLLYGPPGTGKTLLAKAVATECKTTFFNISASSIVSKWRGDSEKLVRVLFELARFHAPSTIFMDELESIMGQRGIGAPGGEHEGSRRMKTELLVQMDGLAKSTDLVFLLAASNIPWELDHAMLRRLEKRILVDLPIESARAAMFSHYLPPVISHQPLCVTTDIDYLTVARLTEGYSGSDIRLVSKEAAMRTVRKVFDKLETLTAEQDSLSGLEDIAISPVRTSDVEAAIASTKPSARHLATRYSEWQKEYESV